MIKTFKFLLVLTSPDGQAQAIGRKISFLVLMFLKILVGQFDDDGSASLMSTDELDGSCSTNLRRKRTSDR